MVLSSNLLAKGGRFKVHSMPSAPGAWQEAGSDRDIPRSWHFIDVFMIITDNVELLQHQAQLVCTIQRVHEVSPLHSGQNHQLHQLKHLLKNRASARMRAPDAFMKRLETEANHASSASALSQAHPGI